MNLAIVNFWLLIYGKRISYLKSIIAAVDNGYSASKINLLIHNSVEKRLSQQLGFCGFCKIFQNIFLWSTSGRMIPMLLGSFLHRLSWTTYYWKTRFKFLNTVLHLRHVEVFLNCFWGITVWWNQSLELFIIYPEEKDLKLFNQINESAFEMRSSFYNFHSTTQKCFWLLNKSKFLFFGAVTHLWRVSFLNLLHFLLPVSFQKLCKKSTALR